jgi:hypothetical protein
MWFRPPAIGAIVFFNFFVAYYFWWKYLANLEARSNETPR